MTITRPEFVRALPIVASNIVALVCALVFGWPALLLLVVFILETWLIILLDSVRLALRPGGGFGDAFISFAVSSLFVLAQLWMAIGVLDAKNYWARTTGDLATDFLRYVDSLDLAWPLAAMVIFHVALFVRDRIRGKPDAGLDFLRIFAMLLMSTVGIPMFFLIGQSGALLGIVTVKGAFEIFLAREQLAWETRNAQYQKELREHLAKLDPRGRGTWPTPPPPVNRA